MEDVPVTGLEARLDALAAELAALRREEEAKRKAQDMSDAVAHDSSKQQRLHGQLDRAVLNFFGERGAPAPEPRAASDDEAIPGTGYSFRVQTLLLYNPSSWSSLGQLFVCVVVKIGQMVALQSVWQTLLIPAAFLRGKRYYLDENELDENEADFDDGYPVFKGGLDYPVDYQKLLDANTGVRGVNYILLSVLVFGCFSSTLALVREVDSIKAGFLLFADEAHGYLLARRLDVDRGCRLAACWFVHLLRVVLLIYYVDVQSQLCGSTDGPLELLLNVLALAFVLEIDDILALDLPDANSFGICLSEDRLRLSRERATKATEVLRSDADAIRGAPRSVQLAYAYTPLLCTAGVGFAAFCIAFEMQSYTTDGKLVTIDDDSVYGKKHPALTHFYNWMLYLIIFSLVVDVHSLALIVSRRYDRAERRRAVALLLVVFEGLAVVVLRIVVINYLIGRLLMFHKSTSSFRLDFWASIDPAPDRRTAPSEPEAQEDHATHYDY